MGFIQRIFGTSEKQVFVLGLDGVPFTFLKTHFEDGSLPNLKKLFRDGTYTPMRTVIPTVSGVSWTSFLTGVDPSEHGLFGFVDRNPATMEMTIPISKDIKRETILDDLTIALGIARPKHGGLRRRLEHALDAELLDDLSRFNHGIPRASSLGVRTTSPEPTRVRTIPRRRMRLAGRASGIPQHIFLDYRGNRPINPLPLGNS